MVSQKPWLCHGLLERERERERERDRERERERKMCVPSFSASSRNRGRSANPTALPIADRSAQRHLFIAGMFSGVKGLSYIMM